MAVFSVTHLFVTKIDLYVVKHLDDKMLFESPCLFRAFQAFYKICPPSLLSDPIEMFHPFCCNMYTSSPFWIEYASVRGLEAQDMRFIIMY